MFAKLRQKRLETHQAILETHRGALFLSLSDRGYSQTEAGIVAHAVHPFEVRSLDRALEDTIRSQTSSLATQRLPKDEMVEAARTHLVVCSVIARQAGDTYYADLLAGHVQRYDMKTGR